MEHSSKVTKMVKDFLDSEQAFQSLDDLAEKYLDAVTKDRKDSVSQSIFVQSQHSESDKMRMINEILHGMLPKLTTAMHTLSVNEHHLDVTIAQAFADSESEVN